LQQHQHQQHQHQQPMPVGNSFMDMDSSSTPQPVGGMPAVFGSMGSMGSMGIGGFAGGSGFGQLGGPAAAEPGLGEVRMQLEQVTQEKERLRQALFAAESKAQSAVDELQAFQARIQPAVAEAAADRQKSRGEAERYKRLAEQQEKQIRALQGRLVRACVRACGRAGVAPQQPMHACC
jgi:hypothetical protein